MAYKFMTDTSYGRMRRYASQVIGGLRARIALRERVGAWETIRTRIVDQRADREQVDDGVLEASTWARVEDAGWDGALGALSSRAYELAGKKADEEPYATLFGAIDAKRARTLGPAKATEVGNRVVRDGKRLDSEGLGSQLTALEEATAKLSEAKSAVDAADDRLFTPRQAKKKLIRELNELIAVTEAAILTAFPGADEIVSAILLPWFERKGARKGATTQPEEPDPLTPDLDDEADDGPES